MMRHEQQIFGDMNDYQLWTDVEPGDVKVGDEVTLVNSNCEFTFDNVKGVFENNLLYCIVCDLDFKESDLTEYQVEKSNNGGQYAFATATITKIKEINY